MATVRGYLVLTPEGEARQALSDDHQKMADDGLLFDEAEPFEQLIEKCREIQERINTRYRASEASA